MRFSPRGDSIQQNRQTVFRFKAIEIRAIGTELSEKRRVVRGYSLPDDRDAKLVEFCCWLVDPRRAVG